MRFNRLTAFMLVLLALPIAVALFGVSPWGAFALVAIALFWRWFISLSGLIAPRPGPELVLETIPASHFVEKARWALDRLGVDYEERPNIGALGVFFVGRTVPLLHIRTGAVTSRIGDSPAILRYLWGAYGATRPDRAAFLEPDEAALELEARLDRYGTWMQRWVYYHLLPERRTTLHAWGTADTRVPAWQRFTAWLIYPLLSGLMGRAFRISEEGHTRNLGKIDQLLAECEARLTKDNRGLLPSGQRSYVDYTFAALSGLWVMPPEFGAGKADAVREELNRYPTGMQAEIASWRKRFPAVTDFIETLYRTERLESRPA